VLHLRLNVAAFQGIDSNRIMIDVSGVHDCLVVYYADNVIGFNMKEVEKKDSYTNKRKWC
jgi:hypothetical protein